MLSLISSGTWSQIGGFDRGPASRAGCLKCSSRSWFVTLLHLVHECLFLGAGPLVNGHPVGVLLGLLLERCLLLELVVDARRACMLLSRRQSRHPHQSLLEQLVVNDLGEVLVAQVVVIRFCHHQGLSHIVLTLSDYLAIDLYDVLRL